MTNKPEPFDEMDAAAAVPATTPVHTPAAKTDGVDPWEEKAQEYLHGWKRAQADYQNLRKAVEQERVDMMKYANLALLQDLLPLVDHFNLAFKAIPEQERRSSWLKGVEHIRANLLQVLSEYGVSQIEAKGQPFDPKQHESVGEVASDQAEGVVAEVVNTGFMLHGKVIQPAKVKVSIGIAK